MFIERCSEEMATQEMRELRENGARIQSVEYSDGQAIIYYC